MHNRKFRLVTAILLLLIAAVVNIFFIYHAYDGAGQEPVQPAVNAPRPREVSSPPPAHSTVKAFLDIRWYSDIVISRSRNGEYELSVLAYARGSRNPFPLDSVEVDVRRPGEDAGMTPKLESPSPGVFTGRIDFPSQGTWEVRVRMHHGLQTLEFAKKFEIE